jgi:hypothetical protein
MIPCSIFVILPARVAELVDAADSKSAVRKNVLVRFQSRAQLNACRSLKSIDLQVFLCLVTLSLSPFMPLITSKSGANLANVLANVNRQL